MNFIKINNDGITITLKKGIKSTLVYENFKIVYNPKVISETVNKNQIIFYL